MKMMKMAMIIGVPMRKIFFRFLVSIVLKGKIVLCIVRDKKGGLKRLKKMQVLGKLKTKIVQKAIDQIDIKNLILICTTKKRLKEKKENYVRKS